ncbi:hypothetical protein [Desulfolutivibrio sulfoxidireducens]|uniref:hypothetical protein n=1 Tax=Desulfolutivibrio sulfoxidireducens TaxID=2773299 RepID=UPI00159E6053|nr:hypothetical protein [Desulfolutivibrio sulfoxidireducens]QLA15750.1 hypothetical protein GD605_06115 [Desulfolutivibrio sulfoxidireducens]
MTPDEEGLFPFDLVLDPNTHYFLFIGEARYDPLNPFMREALERRTGRRMDYVAVIPDVSGCRLPRNTLVVNPAAKNLLARTGMVIKSPMTAREFAAAASASATVRELARTLARDQGEVFVHVAESVPELTLRRMPGLRLIGPDGEVAAMWNNRLFQLRMLRDLVPQIEHRHCRSLEETAEAVRDLLPKWPHGVRVMKESAGEEERYFVAKSPSDMALTHPGVDCPAFLYRHVPHEHAPTVLGVTAGENDVFIAAVADRQMERGVLWGASYPSVLPEHIVTEVREHARMAGKVLGGSGYRGVFGCDFIVDKDGAVHFVEINARKHGAALEMCCTLESALPTGAPTLADLELCAVFENRLPESAVELTRALEGLFWRTRNVRAPRDMVAEDGPERPKDVRALFRHVLSRGAGHGMIILEPPARACLIGKGGLLGRVVAVAGDPAYLAEDIEIGRRILLSSCQDAPANG